MRITVTSITNSTNGLLVEFLSQYGTGQGHWTEGLPNVDQEYDVEIDLDDPLKFGENIKRSDDEVPRIYCLEQQTSFIAKIENVLDDDTVSLRLGDSLILAEYEGAFPNVGTWVEITPKRVELADTRV